MHPRTAGRGSDSAAHVVRTLCKDSSGVFLLTVAWREGSAALTSSPPAPCCLSPTLPRRAGDQEGAEQGLEPEASLQL